MLIKKLLGPADLTKAQSFYIYELMKVIIFNKNKNFVFSVFQIVSLNLKNPNNRQKLHVLSFILSFGQDYLL